MDKAQTDSVSEAPATPQEERAARHLRMLARAADIHMEIMEATRTEAVEAPQPGIDYGQRIAVITKSLRLTLLLEQKFAGQRDERRKAAAQREAAQEDWHDLRVKLAMLAAAYESSEDPEEVQRHATEVRERVERPEVAELIEASRAEVAVAALCRRWDFPRLWSAGSRWPTWPWSIWASYRRRTARTTRIRPRLAPPRPSAASRRTQDDA